MQRLSLQQDIHSVSEFRTKATSFLATVQKTKRPIVITQHGKGVAVLLDVGEYDHLMEQLDILQDVCLAEQQAARGESLSHQEAIDRLLGKIKK